MIANPYAKKNKQQKSASGASGRAPGCGSASLNDGTKFHPDHALSPVSPSLSTGAAKGSPMLPAQEYAMPGASNASALIVAASNKAGMEGIDRARIDAIILRESGNSLFMQQQRKRDERVNQRIARLQAKLDESSFRPTLVTEAALDERLSRTYRIASRSTCVVIDMDMFYMACELLSRPDLRDKPACVGEGMLSTSNYHARRFGVRAAMPGFIADKLVEELSGGKEKLYHVPPNFALYRSKAETIRAVLAQFDPDLRSFSLDEAYLDIAQYLVLRLRDGLSHEQIQGKRATVGDDNDAEILTNDQIEAFLGGVPSQVCLDTAGEIVKDMRERVFRATELTCSAGLAPNHMLAKIASDKNKPNGQYVIDPLEALSFVKPLETRKIPGIGRVTQKILHSFGIDTVEDIYRKRCLVQFLFLSKTSEFLLRSSLGCDSSSLDYGNVDDEDEQDQEKMGRKSVSRERTFSAQQSWSQLNMILEDIAYKLSLDLREQNIMAHTVTVKVKLHDFEVVTRARSCQRGIYVQAPEELASIGAELFRQVRAEYSKKLGSSVAFSCRLLGLRCSNLIESGSNGTTQQTIEKFLSKSDSNEQGFEVGAPQSLSESEMACPICGAPFYSKYKISVHVDTCLNRMEGKDERPIKRHRISDYFGKQ